MEHRLLALWRSRDLPALVRDELYGVPCLFGSPGLFFWKVMACESSR